MGQVHWDRGRLQAQEEEMLETGDFLITLFKSLTKLFMQIKQHLEWHFSFIGDFHCFEGLSNDFSIKLKGLTQ